MDPLPNLLSSRRHVPSPFIPDELVKQEAEYDTDEFILPNPHQRWQDSVVHVGSNLRRELECNLAEFLKRQLSSGSVETAENQPQFARLQTASTSEPLLGIDSQSTLSEPGPPFKDELEALPASVHNDARCDTQGSGTKSATLNGCTTLMIRHIPPKLTQRQLMREVNDRGFAGRFDFVYVPMDSRRRASRGIAFVNFASGAVAEEFARAVDGHPLRHPSSQRAVEIMPADLQGFDRNVEHHAETLRSHTDSNKPLVLRRLPPHLVAGVGSEDARGGRCAKAAGTKPRRQEGATKTAPPAAGADAAVPASQAAALAGRPAPCQRQGVNFCACCGTRKRKEHVFCPCCGFRLTEFL